MSKPTYESFELELERLVSIAKAQLTQILLSPGRIAKHKPYSWMDETQKEHLIKGARHAMTHLNTVSGFQEDDGDNHLANAITRLVMAVGANKGDQNET